MTKQILKTNSLYCRNQRTSQKSRFLKPVFFFFALLNILYRESYKTVLKQNKKQQRDTHPL